MSELEHVACDLCTLYSADWLHILPAAPAAPMHDAVWASIACPAAPNDHNNFSGVWKCLDELENQLGELAFRCAERFHLETEFEPHVQEVKLTGSSTHTPGPIVLSLTDLLPIPASNEVPRNICDECAKVLAKSECFVNGMRDFICEAYNECEDLIHEPYMSAGFFESCFCVQFMILDELSSFGEPSMIHDLIEFEYGDT